MLVTPLVGGSGYHTSPRLASAYMQEFVYQWNIKAGIKHLNEVHAHCCLSTPPRYTAASIHCCLGTLLPQCTAASVHCYLRMLLKNATPIHCCLNTYYCLVCTAATAVPMRDVVCAPFIEMLFGRLTMGFIDMSGLRSCRSSL